MKLVNFRGLYPIQKKETVGIDITSLRSMEFYNVPLKIKMIAESEPVVQVGDVVKQGTLIAKPSGNFGVSIFSPVGGKVLNIYSKQNADGETCKHILIMNNHENDVQDLKPIDSVSDVTLISRLKEAGMIDTISFMPTYLKYAYVGSKPFRTLLILMDSTDPNDTTFQTIAEYKMEEVVNGAKYFMNITSATSITFVFTEANTRLAHKLKKHIQETKKNYDFKIKFIPNKYPFHNPYILANLVCGKKINQKQSFLDAGITIETAEACYNFCRAVEFNKPVTGKVVTIDGDNVIRKGNYLVPNGVSYDSLFDFIGFQTKEAPIILINGNVLSGTAQYSTELSVTLTTNSLVCLKYDELSLNKEYPCISCGKCASVCPVFLNPKEIDKAYLNEGHYELKKLNIHSCIECGCCSYVCPAKRFLTQRIAAAKKYDKASKGGFNE